jgi:glycosyltransferase involved in cell wall biosynthesis
MAELPGAKTVGSNDSRRLPRLLFLFPHSVAEERKNVESGTSPTERLYGAHELQQLGWPVSYSDSRFRGLTGRLLKFLRQFAVIGISAGTVRDIARSDVVIVKDDFSAPAAIVTRLLGRKLVFLDSMFAPPKRWWKVLGTRISLRLAHETICYSEFQKQLWVEHYGKLAQRIRVMPYTIDVGFYKRYLGEWKPGASRKVLAVGRDVGRDYGTLVEALRGTDLELELITLPYLLRGVDIAANPKIKLHQRLSYEDLFRLYRECAVVVIPLKPGISYPSGIRGLFEAMVLQRPFVTTRTEVLQEYMTEGEHGDMVPANDAVALRSAILACLERGEGNRQPVAAAARLVEERFDASVFGKAFDLVLRRLTGLALPDSK